MHADKLSSQIHTLNDSQLAMRKENEFMKTKMRMMENQPPPRRVLAGSSSSSMKSLIKMDDEIGEEFSETFLNELKAGIVRSSPTRPSIRFVLNCY